MTDRRGPQPSGADRSDLTPAEARAEVEAFMGEGYEVGFILDADHVYVDAENGPVRVFGAAPTYRAAVDALKAAWRDAVRPWAEQAVCASMDSLYLDTLTTEPAKATDANVVPLVARILKEDSNG